MLWKECISQKFYKYICKNNNFLYLNGKNVLQPKVSDIITDFYNEDKNSYIELRNNLSQHKDIFQYVYSIAFPERVHFTLFKTYKDKKNLC